jgi:hypothetical protein
LKRWVLIALLALAIIPASSLGYAEARAVNIVVGQDSVTLNMNIGLQENLTALPPINAHVSLANTTTIVQPFLQWFNQAVQSRVTNARVSDLDISVRTSNTSSTWLLDENYSITVTGANTNSGSNIKSNLGFIPMNLSQPMQVEAAEINGIGPTYLLPALAAKAAAYANLQYYIDGSNPRTAVIPEQTTKGFWLLDFTWVSPVSTWTSNNNILGQSSQWTLDPPNPRYNLTLGVPSPEGPLIAKYVAIYSPSMSLTVPANAWINGNTLFFDTPTPVETVMPAIIVASLITMITTLFLNRRLTSPLRARRKR